MNQPDATAFRTLLARLVADSAHHTRCAAVARTPETSASHDGMAAAFQIAALYVAELATTGSLQSAGGHVVQPEDQAEADRVLAALADGPTATWAAIRGISPEQDTAWRELVQSGQEEAGGADMPAALRQVERERDRIADALLDERLARALRSGGCADAAVARIREYVETSDDDGIRTRETVLRILGDGDGRHVYLSTGCLHGEHDYCQSKTGKAGAKKPAGCKFCGAPCVCGCHPGRP